MRFHFFTNKVIVFDIQNDFSEHMNEVQNHSEVESLLRGGAFVVLPTDTIYGICATALDMTAVERLYALRKRDPSKPMIVLISSIDDLKTFDISLTSRQENILEQIWPGKVSVVLHCGSKNFSYLHRGTYSLAVRMPNKKDLLEILNVTGPLVAPSANIEGEPPAKNIQEASDILGITPIIMAPRRQTAKVRR